MRKSLQSYEQVLRYPWGGSERQAAIGRLFYGWRRVERATAKAAQSEIKKRSGEKAGGASASAWPGAWLEM